MLCVVACLALADESGFDAGCTGTRDFVGRVVRGHDPRSTTNGLKIFGSLFTSSRTASLRGLGRQFGQARSWPFTLMNQVLLERQIRPIYGAQILTNFTSNQR